MTVAELFLRHICSESNNECLEVFGLMASEAWENKLITDEEFAKINAALDDGHN